MTTIRSVRYVRNESTMSYEARCPECGDLVSAVTFMDVILRKMDGQLVLPVAAGHECSTLAGESV